jgi:acetoin utilization protein AcuB
MQLVDIMTRRIVTVDMDDGLHVVKEIFDHARFHHLLVVDGKQLVGVISDRDLLKQVSPRVGAMSETTADRATLNRKAHQIMSRHPVTATPRCDVAEGARLLLEQGVSCLPVVDGRGHPLGVVSWRDLLAALADPQPVRARASGT